MNNKELLKLFDELTKFTYIYGLEDELMKIINPLLSKPLSRDSYGNYFLEIGDSKTLFCCHLDTVGGQKLKVNKIYYEKDGRKFVKTDGNTILGADDKTGMVIMLNMIYNNVPGLYYFLIGEEKGTVGSKLLYDRKSKMILSKYDRCIAFDRRGYGSIINRQMGKYCCSDEFVDALSKEFKNTGMIFKADPTGVWTDSALFMSVIPECTNLSVGYFNEHTKKEEQDLDYMLEMCKSVLNINWENLPVVRVPMPFDTKDPKEIEEKPEHLPQYKLLQIFEEVEEVIYETTKQFCSNSNFFKPEKEMTFFHPSDLDNEYDFSVFVHTNGSITFKKDDIITKVDDIEMLRLLDDYEYIEDILLFDTSWEFGYDENGELIYYVYESMNMYTKFDEYIKEQLDTEEHIGDWYHGGFGEYPEGEYLYVTDDIKEAKYYANLKEGGSVFKLKDEFNHLVDWALGQSEGMIRQELINKNGGFHNIFKKIK